MSSHWSASECYIAGPMRGLPMFNFPAFMSAQRWLESRYPHATVYNPAEHDMIVCPGIVYDPSYATGEGNPKGFAITDAMRWDVEKITRCRRLYVLPGWESSEGVRVELEVTKACGVEVVYLYPDPVKTWRETGRYEGLTIVGLSGYARAGKDTVGAWLVEHRGYERVAFADALKDVLYDVAPLVESDCSPVSVTPVSRATTWMLDTLVQTVGWERAKTNGFDTDFGARQYLQRLGAAVREHVDPDAWLNAALRKLKPGGRYVITDVRFPNEADALRERGGKIVRLNRGAPVNGHASETALDEYAFDLRIENEGTLDTLTRRLEVEWPAES